MHRKRSRTRRAAGQGFGEREYAKNIGEGARSVENFERGDIPIGSGRLGEFGRGVCRAGRRVRGTGMSIRTTSSLMRVATRPKVLADRVELHIESGLMSGVLGVCVDCCANDTARGACDVLNGAS